MKSKRAYDNTAREEGMAETREAILRACVAVLSMEGLQDLSIAAVAREAGVTARTVFRHFPSREALLEEAWKRVVALTGMERYPQTEGELRAGIVPVFEKLDEQAELVRAMVLSPGGWEVRARGNAMRRAGLSKAMAGVVEGLPAKERRRAIAVVHTLFSASAWQVMRDREGMSGKEAGEAVAWAVGVLLDAIREESRRAGAKASSPGARKE